MSDNFIDELFYPGNTVQVEYRENLTAKKILLTIVNSIDEEHIHLIYPPEDSNDSAVSIPVGTGMILCVREKNTTQIYYYSSRLIEHKSGNPDLLVMERPSFAQYASRRNFFRCDVDFPFYYWIEKQQYKGLTCNLSASGMYGIIQYDPQLKPEMILQLEIPIPLIPAPLGCEARIIRLSPAENPDQRGVALHFENPDEKLQNELTKYLFQRQRELIKKGMIKIGRIH
jgi:c-di-GMP-binding flagellar brake protein YcgR